MTGASAALGFFLAVSDISTARLLVLATAAVLLLPLIARAAAHSFDPFEPIFVFALAYGVMFVLRPTSMERTHDFVYTIAGVGVDIGSTFVQALTLGLIGAVGFVAGHESRWGPRLARRGARPIPAVDLRRVTVIALIVGLSGLLLYGFFLALQGGVSALALVLAGRSEALRSAVQGSTKYYLFGPLLLIPTTLILTATGMYWRRVSMYGLAAVAAGVLILIAGSTGSRGTLLPLVGGLLVYVYATLGRRPRGVTLVLVAAVALMASSFLLATRNPDSRAQLGFGGAVGQLITKPQTALEPLYRGQDAAEVPALAAALTVMPSEVPHTYGRATIGDLFIRGVPRALWADKPIPPREDVIQALWPRAYQSRAASPEFSTLLYWYMDAGVIGILVGMFALGMLARAAYEWFLIHADHMMARILYALALPLLVSLVRDSPTDALSRAVFVAFPVWIVFRLARTPRRTRSRPLITQNRPVSAQASRP